MIPPLVLTTRLLSVGGLAKVTHRARPGRVPYILVSEDPTAPLHVRYGARIDVGATKWWLRRAHS